MLKSNKATDQIIEGFQKDHKDYEWLIEICIFFKSTENDNWQFA